MSTVLADVISIASLEGPGGHPGIETAEAAARWKGAAAGVGAGTCRARRGSPSATRPPQQKRGTESPSRLMSEIVTTLLFFLARAFSSMEWLFRLPLPP